MAAPQLYLNQQHHQSVVEMFPELNLERTIAEYGHMSSEALASWIVDNLETMPKKQRGMKRKATSPDRESNSSDRSFFDDSNELERTQMNKMLWDIVRQLKREMRSIPPVSREQFAALQTALANHFPSVRLEHIRRVVMELSGRLVAIALACYLSENNVPYSIQQEATGLAKIVPPIKTKRLQRHRLDLGDSCLSRTIYNELGRYEGFIDSMRIKYPQLFDSAGRLNHAIHPDDDEEEKMECLVCFEDISISSMVFCSAPFHREEEFNANTPSTSALAAEASIESSPVHAFCAGCIRGHAQATVEEMPLASCGLGLRCMMPDCKNPILYAEVCHLIKKDVKRKLDERIVEENLGMANLGNLERCPACNFAMQMDVPPEIDKVFKCRKCDAETCRLCERPWDEDHFGRSCQEVEEKCKDDKRARQLEARLNEAVIRKCPRCSLAFVKSEGCNKMTCRCGIISCYICRQTPIDYSHFCQHIRDPTQKNYKCPQCDKPCLLYEDPTLKDNKQLEEIRQQAANEQQPDEQPAAVNPGADAPMPNAAADVQNVQANPPPLNREQRPLAFQGFMQGLIRPDRWDLAEPWADLLHPDLYPYQAARPQPLPPPQLPYPRLQPTHPQPNQQYYPHPVQQQFGGGQLAANNVMNNLNGAHAYNHQHPMPPMPNAVHFMPMQLQGHAQWNVYPDRRPDMNIPHIAGNGQAAPPRFTDAQPMPLRRDPYIGNPVANPPQ